jgi:hypothetical protein
MVLRRSHISAQNLPSPVNYGWDNVDGSFIPILTDKLPAPMALIELISACSCKSQCTTNRCKCRKNGFFCTDMCKCGDCKNNDDNEEDIENFSEEEAQLDSDDEF